MSLQVWLPLNGDLHNQGLSSTTFSGTAAYKSYGKLGGQSLNLQNRITCSTPALNGVQFFSIAFWSRIEANPDSTANWMDVIGFTDQKSDNSATGQFRFETGYGSDTQGGVHWHDNATNAIIDGASTYNTAAQRNEWHHIVVTVANDSIKSYYDGSLLRTHTTNLNKGHLTGAWWLGESTTRGCIQDVRIYDHTLSPKEVEEIAKGLVLHYKLDNNGMGGENILTNSTGFAGTANWSGLVTVGNENGHPYLIAKRTDTTSTSRTFCTHTAITSLVSSWLPGDKFTISGWYKVPSSETQETGGNMFIRWAQSSSSNGDADTGFTTSTTTKDVWIRFENTYTVPPNFASGKAANFYLSAFAAQKRATVYWKDVKLEKGDKATIWSPSPSDAIYPADFKTTIYDSSGYSNNGTIIGSLAAAAGSPRYDVATIFNGTNSTIKVMDNNWCSQGMEAMTINVWVKSTSWPTNVRIFSCTESGGFNTEGGSSGYYRFPINVYTNAEKTSHAYKYDGQELQISSLSTTDWIMLTFVYDLTGTKTYINGELHHTYTNTSYGIYFNMNARLFLGCEANTANPSTPYFNGQQSDFRIYTTALTVAQIKELYNTSMSIDSNGNVYARELVEL